METPCAWVLKKAFLRVSVSVARSLCRYPLMYALKHATCRIMHAQVRGAESLESVARVEREIT